MKRMEIPEKIKKNVKQEEPQEVKDRRKYLGF